MNRFSPPYFVREVESFLRKEGVDTTYLFDEINCLEKENKTNVQTNQMSVDGNL